GEIGGARIEPHQRVHALASMPLAEARDTLQEGQAGVADAVAREKPAEIRFAGERLHRGVANSRSAEARVFHRPAGGECRRDAAISDPARPPAVDRAQPRESAQRGESLVGHRAVPTPELDLLE